MKKIAIVGFGRFGQFLAAELLKQTKDVELLVVSRRQLELSDARLRQIEFNGVVEADIVILTVAISAFKSVCKQLAGYCKSDHIVIDMCSVKEHPVQCMRQFLPESVELIACHPMFGPDSAAKNGGVSGLPIMLWPERCQDATFAKILQFCQRLKLAVAQISPEEHDRHAAYTQAYAFLIGRLGQEMQLPTTPLDTWWYSVLREQSQAVAKDDPQLFWDIQRFNRFAGVMRQKLQAKLTDLIVQIDNKK